MGNISVEHDKLHKNIYVYSEEWAKTITGNLFQLINHRSLLSRQYLYVDESPTREFLIKEIEKLKERQIIYKDEATSLLKIRDEHIGWVNYQIKKYC